MKSRPSPWVRASGPQPVRQQAVVEARESALAPVPDSALSPDSSPITIYAWTREPFWRSAWITLCRFHFTNFSAVCISQPYGTKARAAGSCLCYLHPYRPGSTSRGVIVPSASFPSTKRSIHQGTVYKRLLHSTEVFLKTIVQGIAFLLLLCAVPALGQERPTVTAQANTVFVGADGKFDATPDTALVQFNISAQEDTSAAAYARASKAAEQIRQILRSNGIEPKAAEIGFFSLQPVYDYKTPKRKLLAYRVNASVSLKVKDFSKIGSIVQQLSESDITQNQSLSY